MELFKVTCVTCQASLSVRNAALVGQIVACPKCNSMVHVAPPAGPATAAKPTPTAEPQLTQPVAEESVEQLLEETTEPAELGSILETTAASPNVNFIIWSVASFAIGATLTGLFLVLRAGNAEDQTIAAQLPISAPVENSEPTLTAKKIAKTLPDPQPSEQPSAVVAREEIADSPDVEPTLLGPIEVPVEEQPASSEKPVEPADPEPVPKLVVAPPESPRVARKFDPLSLDPEQLDLADVSEATTVDEPAQPDQEMSLEEAAPIADPAVNLPVRFNQDARGVSGNRSANVQLRQQVSALVVKETKLLDFLSLASQLAGVPVSVAPEQLQMAGISPAKSVTVDVQSANLTETLNAALKPLRLEVSTEGPQVIIRREAADKVRSVDYPIDDLLADKLEAADVAEWIEQLIAPESWQGRGGEGEITVSEKALTIQHAQVIQYQILFFLERIRLAKGLPLRSRYPERLLSAKPLAVGIADRLEAPATFTFSHETPLVEVFHHWQNEMGLPIFVDWPALGNENIWPDSLATCSIANEQWHAALDRILAPLDLGWRPAPLGAIEITSRARLETEPQLEIYPEGTWQGDSTEAVVINDPTHKLTYVRASAAAHRESTPAISQ